MDTDEAQLGLKKVPSQNIPTRSNNNTDTQKQNKLKPIVLPAGAEPMKTAIRILKETAPQVKFLIDRKATSTHIISHSAADKASVIKALDDGKIEYFTFAENNERHTIFGLRKLPLMEASEVLEMLKDDKYPAEHVRIMIGGEFPIYLVFFKKNATSLHFLNSRRTVGHSIVQWTHAPSNKRPAQCKRCQRWGHSANHCGFIARCVKCDVHHLTKDCPRKDREVGQPKCVNCGKEGHPANSPSCEVFIAFNKRNLERRRPQRAEARHFAPAPKISPWSTRIQRNGRQQLVSEFPPLISPHGPSAHSTSRAHFVNAESNQNTNARPDNTSRDLFAEIQMLREGFGAIPDLGECIDAVKTLLLEMQATNSFNDRKNLLFSFVSGCSP